MKDSKGWDGKLRVEPKATITNPEALEDPDYSDEDAPPVEEINADEGEFTTAILVIGRRRNSVLIRILALDLLEDEDKAVEVYHAIRNT
jgi:hypothetical protein